MEEHPILISDIPKLGEILKTKMKEIAI